MVMGSVATLVTAPGGANLVVAELIAGSTVGFYLQQMKIAMSDATPGTYFLRKTLTLGITPVLGSPLVYGGVGTMQVRVANSWGTRPVANSGPVGYAIGLPGTIGATDNYDFTNSSNKNGEGLGLFVPPNTSLSVFSVLATGAPYITFQVLEL